MTLTVKEKEHWKERISRKIDQAIDALCAENDPTFHERIRIAARQRSRTGSGGPDAVVVVGTVVAGTVVGGTVVVVLVVVVAGWVAWATTMWIVVPRSTISLARTDCSVTVPSLGLPGGTSTRVTLPTKP